MMREFRNVSEDIFSNSFFLISQRGIKKGLLLLDRLNEGSDLGRKVSLVNLGQLFVQLRVVVFFQDEFFQGVEDFQWDF